MSSDISRLLFYNLTVYNSEKLSCHGSTIFSCGLFQSGVLTLTGHVRVKKEMNKSFKEANQIETGDKKVTYDFTNSS